MISHVRAPPVEPLDVNPTDQTDMKVSVRRLNILANDEQRGGMPNRSTGQIRKNRDKARINQLARCFIGSVRYCHTDATQCYHRRSAKCQTESEAVREAKVRVCSRCVSKHIKCLLLALLGTDLVHVEVELLAFKDVAREGGARSREANTSSAQGARTYVHGQR